MSGMRQILLATGLLLMAAAGASADPLGDLAVARWEGSLLMRRIDGAVAVLAGEDGSLRWEISTAPDTALSSLLDRRGRGWTVVVAPDGRGTRNAWGEEWHTLDADRARVLAAATEAALGTDRSRRVVVAGDARRLRARLVRRGAGRGGPGEILRLNAAAGGGTVLSSSRRPGTLRLTAWRRHPVRYPARESFLPLWPLAELLEFTAEIGNPGD